MIGKNNKGTGAVSRQLFAALMVATMFFSACRGGSATQTNSSGSSGAPEGGTMEAQSEIEVLLARCEASGKLSGIEIEYYVGGGLPPPNYVSNQFRLLVVDGQDVLQFAKPVFDKRYNPYPMEVYTLPATPADVKTIAGLILRSRAFSPSSSSNPPIKVPDALRTELVIKAGTKEETRTFQGLPEALQPLKPAVEALIEQLKAKGAREYRHEGKKIELKP
jgi:hypothetical protein